MTPRRVTVSLEAETMSADDFATLLTVAEELARKLVNEHGVTAPFAVLLFPDGSTRTVAVQSRTETSPRAVELVDGLVRNLRERAKRKEFRAVAICATGYAGRPDTGEQARAILVGLESAGGETESVVLPYSRGLYESYVFHPAVRQPGKAVVFCAVEPSSG